MLIMLLKIILFLAAILVVALLAIRLGETGESLQLIVAGRSYELGLLDVVIAVLALMLVGWALFRLLGVAVAALRFLLGDETALNRHFRRARIRKGYEALGEGMLSVASGEGKLALSQAQRAEKYLDQPALTNVLKAQAAEVLGDDRIAEATYRAMLDDQRTRFVAIRGLMQQRLAKGDTEAALELARKAYALKPGHVGVQDELLRLQAGAHDWKGARAVLKAKRKQGQLPGDVAIRRDAVLALQEASEVLAEGSSISAREAAISANRASPDLIPAAVLAARSYIARGDTRNAARVLQKTWSLRPHPALAAAYAEIAPDETPARRLARFGDLIRQNRNDPETRLLEAELLLAAEDFPGARRALGNLAVSDPTVRSLSLMAAIERGEGGDESVVRGWLARALTASRGPQWVCDNCQNVMVEWSPVCDSCGGFDTLSWRVPAEKPGEAEALRAATAMLPLIVGPSGAHARPAPHPTAPHPTAFRHDAAPVEVEADPADDIPDVPPGIVPRESDYPTPKDPPRPPSAPAAATPADGVAATPPASTPPVAPDGKATKPA